MATSPTQFGRAANLFLANASSALDLSNMHFKFDVFASDVETPNTAVIRVYNLSQQTVNEAISEYSSVVLQAGYGDQPGEIFRGTVKQFRKGKERNVDSYLEILAADGDVGYNFGFVNKTLEAGATGLQVFQALADSLGYPADPAAQSYLGGTGGILPRGKVLFGLARSYMRDLATTRNLRWSIQKGVLTLIPLDAYLPGDAVVINSATGMVGVPEATDQGITVQMLLNPQIKMGQSIRLNNKDITTTIIKQQFFPGYTDLNLVATVDSSDDGTYRVIVVEHTGDTRDQEWYTKVTCLLISQSAQGTSNPTVQPYPGSG